MLPESIRTKILSLKAALYFNTSGAMGMGMGMGVGMGGGPAVAAKDTKDTKDTKDAKDSKASATTNPMNAAPFSYDELVTTYVDLMTTGTTTTNQTTGVTRTTYVPLGDLELQALCRLYAVRLQTMSTASLFKSLNAVTVDEVDPRLVPASDVHEFDRSQSRIVRLLNIKVSAACAMLSTLTANQLIFPALFCSQSNHYNVHLPIDPNSKEDDSATTTTSTPTAGSGGAATASATSTTNSAPAPKNTAYSSFNYWSDDSMLIAPNDLPPL